MVIQKTDRANAWMEHLKIARAHLHELSALSRGEDFGQHLHAAAALELMLSAAASLIRIVEK